MQMARDRAKILVCWQKVGRDAEGITDEKKMWGL